MSVKLRAASSFRASIQFESFIANKREITYKKVQKAIKELYSLYVILNAMLNIAGFLQLSKM